MRNPALCRSPEEAQWTRRAPEVMSKVRSHTCSWDVWPWIEIYSRTSGVQSTSILAIGLIHIALDAHRMGRFWKKIPRYEDRGRCHRCGVEDSIDYILTHCQAPGQNVISRLTEKVWKKKGLEWPGLTLEAILGAPLRQWTKAG